MLNVECWIVGFADVELSNFELCFDNLIMTIGEYFENLKALADHAGADKTGVKIETDDGYCIDITVTKKQNKK